MILHVDMDAFYASVEQRDRRELRGRPVIVGGTGRRAVVTTASYEARPTGVRSAMPMFKARQLCPEAVIVAPRMSHYAAVSAQLREIYGRFSPVIEPLSLDEASLDLTGTERLFGPPEQVGMALKEAIRSELGLTASVGIATGKRIAKIASDVRKPDGMTVVHPGGERAFLAPMPVERLPGVGPKALELLHRLGVVRVGDLSALEERVVRGRLGDGGVGIWRLARGEDTAPVRAERERKSLGAERTLAEDVSGESAVRRALLPLVDEVARGLRAEGIAAGGVRLKLKGADFRTVTREVRLEHPTAEAAALRAGLDRLLVRVSLSGPFRLVGVAATALASADAPAQLALFEAAAGGVQTSPEGASPTSGERRQSELGPVLDRIEARFGQGALRRASVPSGGRSLPGGGGSNAEPASVQRGEDGSSEEPDGG